VSSLVNTSNVAISSVRRKRFKGSLAPQRLTSNGRTACHPVVPGDTAAIAGFVGATDANTLVKLRPYQTPTALLGLANTLRAGRGSITRE